MNLPAPEDAPLVWLGIVTTAALSPSVIVHMIRRALGRQHNLPAARAIKAPVFNVRGPDARDNLFEHAPSKTLDVVFNRAPRVHVCKRFTPYGIASETCNTCGRMRVERWN